MKKLLPLLLVLLFSHCREGSGEAVEPDAIYNGRATALVNDSPVEFQLVTDFYGATEGDTVYIHLAEFDAFGTRLSEISFQRIALATSNQVLSPSPGLDKTVATANYGLLDDDLILAGYTVLTTDTFPDFFQLAQPWNTQDTISGTFQFSAVIKSHYTVPPRLGRTIQVSGDLWFVLDR